MGQTNKNDVSLLSAILEGVTPGPWRASQYIRTIHNDEWFVDGGGRTLANVIGYSGPKPLSAKANAHFIALARDLVPTLFQMIYELDDRVFQLNDELTDANQVRRLVDSVQKENAILKLKIKKLEGK